MTDIRTVSLADETRRRYLNYAVSVITARALPDVRDGLKPVQRRILYTMGIDLSLAPTARYVKSAKVVGPVMGNYHPHGDQAIYDAMVRLAQPFSLRYPLVDGHGNFGSLDGDGAAAMRYTEARLQAIAMETLDDLAHDTVAFRPNYDDTRKEPSVLPARFPMLLANGSTGIAVGMATSIPPHNLRELIRASVRLIENRNLSVAELLRTVKGPDLPTGGEVVADAALLRKAYETGRGTLRVRGTYRVEQSGRRRLIIIESVPYGVEKAAIVAKIGELIAAKRIAQALDVRDESTDIIRVVIEVKGDADPAKVMAFFYKHSQLQEPLPINLTCLVPGEGGALKPARLDLRQVLVHFLDFRFEVVTRRLKHQLGVLEERIHILHGFATVFADLDDAITIVRAAQGREDASQALRKRFEIDEPQADALLDRRIYQLAELEIAKIEKELREKKKEAREIRGLLASDPKRWDVVRAELEDVAQRYGDDRRSRIVGDAGDATTYDEGDFIADEDTHVVLTRDGWLKRVGRLKSAESTRTREGDAVHYVLPGSTRAAVAFFSNLGAAYVMRIHDVAATSGYGEPIQKHFKFADGERIVGAVSLDARLLPERPSPATPAESGSPDGEGEPPWPLLFAATARGNVIRFPIAAHREPSTRAGRRYCRLQDPSDEVLKVEMVTPERPYAVLVAESTRHLVFAVDEVSILLGPGKGVRGIKLEKGDRLVVAALSKGQGDPVKIETSGGVTREIAVSSRGAQGRGTKGRELVKRETVLREVPPLVAIPVIEGAEDAAAGVESGNAEGGEGAQAE